MGNYSTTLALLITGSLISIYFEEFDIKKRKLGLDKF